MMTTRFGRRRVSSAPSDRNLTYAIVDNLGHAIVTGSYGIKKGFPVEAVLCKEFGASRSVLREAVKMLTAKGLLAARPRQGTWVEPEEHWNLLDPDVLRWLLERKFSLELLTEFTEMRMAVEPMAATLAARNAKPITLAPIRAAIDRMRAAEKGDDDPLESDIAFHVAVLRASGNRFYAQLEDLIDTALRISIRLTNQVKGVALANVADHKRIADAIEARDPKKANAAMTALLNEAMELIATAGRKARRRA
jgi:DNA-binding FadR family transcriptional regulator